MTDEPPPTNQPADALPITERKRLLGLSHQLRVLLTIGASGVTEGTLTALRDAFKKGDVVKLRVAGDRDRADAIAAELAEKVPCHLVNRVGRVVVLARSEEPSEQS